MNFINYLFELVKELRVRPTITIKVLEVVDEF